MLLFISCVPSSVMLQHAASLSPQNVSGKQGNLLPRQPFKRFSWWVMLHFSVSNRVCVVTAARCRCWSSGHKKLNNSCKCNWITHTHTHTNCTCGEGIVRAVSLKPAFYITECSTFNLSAKTTLLFKGSQEIKVNARNHEEKLKNKTSAFFCLCNAQKEFMYRLSH